MALPVASCMYQVALIFIEIIFFAYRLVYFPKIKIIVYKCYNEDEFLNSCEIRITVAACFQMQIQYRYRIEVSVESWRNSFSIG